MSIARNGKTTRPAWRPSPTRRTRAGWWWPAGLLSLACCWGCAGPKLFTLSKSDANSADVLPANSGELPPKEAARACLVAAAELQNSGHVDNAIQLYEKARRYDPNLKGVSHRLAVLYDFKGNSSQALTEYRKALDADPKNVNLLNDFGYYCWERGNLDVAEQWLRKALEIDSKHQRALSNLGTVLVAQRRYDEALNEFSKAVGPAAAHSNLGVLLAQQGQYDRARAAFREALALDPTLQQPKAFLGYLDRQA
jgi:Tfp pilus assembly protein PilF